MDIVGREQAAGAHDNVFYVGEPGRTGKSFLFNTIINYLNMKINLTSMAVAWTGLAANLLFGGTMVRTAFRLPFNLIAHAAVSWARESEKTRAIAETAVI